MSEPDNPKPAPPTQEALDSSASSPGRRSRSQSRRARRRKQQQGQKGKMQEQEIISEDRDAEDAQAGAIQPSSMNGPVTKARQRRGEESVQQGQKQDGQGESEMMKNDGLKLRIELNLDLELELKAKINGDITLALL